MMRWTRPFGWGKFAMGTAGHGCLAAAASLRLRERDVGDEVAASQLELDDRAVALPAAIAARSNRAEVSAISSLD
ncbi:MAG: hypothetical protein ACYDEY_13720, partial [Acidimicrobiales bacterium]